MDWNTIEKQYKLFEDPIYGYINMNKLSLQFIDTPQFQRLRDLKQLGTLSYIFPSATHTRFEHSLGVSHISSELINKFKYSQPELNITEREINILKLSGLLHDIGHGPFSHVFDNVFIPMVNKDTNYSHEKMSIDMIDYMIDDNNIDIENDDIKLIQNIIMGAKNTNYIDNRNFLYEIVANGNNCIDVDKLDYLSRDMHHLFGNKKTYNFTRLYKYNHIIDNNICYNSKAIFDIYELFRQRYTMHKQIYNHKIGKSIEYMISDVLYYADPILKISDTINHPRDFLNTTDNIVYLIKYMNDNKLNKSKEIIKRIEKRDLYKYVTEYIVPDTLVNVIPKIKKIDISSNTNVNINLDDIIIYDNRINYNLNNQNPVDNVYFYNNQDMTTKFHKSKEDISLLLPNIFEERIIRIYSKTNNKIINKAIKDAFNIYIKQY